MFGFLKNALLRGLIILIPLVILYVTMRELLQIMVGLATPIADLFPAGTFDDENETEIIAVLLIAGTAIFLGSLSAIKPLRIGGKWIEDRTVSSLPMYRMLKSLLSAFLNVEGEKSFKPAFLVNGEGIREPIYVVEERDDGFLVVLQPWSPTAFAGSIKVVKRELVEFLPVTLDEFSLALTHFGVGISDVMEKKAAADRHES